LNGNKHIFVVILWLCFFSAAHAQSVQNNYEKNKANIALLLPFQFQQIDPVANLQQKDFDNANFAIDYYRGFKLGLDSLASLGYGTNLNLFDTENDSLAIENICKTNALQNADLVFGPFYPKELAVVNAFSKKSNKKIISPISPLPVDVLKNKNIIMLNNTLESHAMQMAAFAVNHLQLKKYLVVRSGLLAESRYSKTFSNSIDSIAKGITKKEIIVAKAGLKTIEANLSKYEENYILVPNADQAFAITLFKQLEEYKNNYAITLLVHPKWIDFQTIEPALLQKYKVILTAAYFVDYNLPAVNIFVKKFRDTFFTEPQEMAFKGFDQAMYLLPLMQKIKENNALPTYQGLASKFNLQDQNGLGLKNTAIHILQYCENDLYPIK
jgi:hypothetical protein